jgi:uncharacterized membrane protein
MITNAIPESPRKVSIDLLRGLVMFIMALDHVRDLLHADALNFNPLDETKTTALLYATRWVTNFCAPTFVMLAGASAYLMGTRRTRKALSYFLATRGLWLLFVDLVIMSFGWSFTPHAIVFSVLATMGVSMMILSLLIYLPEGLLPILGFIIVFGHNILDGVQFAPGSLAQFCWSLVHAPGLVQQGSFSILIGYPVLPWLGVMLCGYGLGILFRPGYHPPRRRRQLLTIGVGAILLFLVLRYLNVYGNPVPWKPGANPLQTLMIFFNVLKYPPSLLFLLITLGPVLLLLAFIADKPLRPDSPLVYLGRVPFFFYVLHFHIIHIIGIIVGVAMGHPLGYMLTYNFVLDTAQIKGNYGVSLIWVYVIWLALVAALYPLCKWYAGYKQRHQDWPWLSYL